jgi:antitoxin (DNA-binding transcriptional repressor) of toxin-antitoxin stability system
MLSALVAAAASGEDVIITVRGKPRARLCPRVRAAPYGQHEQAAWGRSLGEARETYSVGVHDTGKDILDDLRGDQA